MSGKKVDEKTISIPEVKKIMEQVKERLSEIDADESMSHFQEITYDYVNKFSKMTDKSALQIKKFLTEQIVLEEVFAINIVNIDPKTVPELRVILEKSAIGKTLNDNQLQELLYQIDELKTS